MSLFGGISDLISSVTSKIQKFATRVVDKVRSVGQKIVNFIDEIKQNGLKSLRQKIGETINNTLVHFKSTENFKELITSLKNRLNLSKIA